MGFQTSGTFDTIGGGKFSNGANSYSYRSGAADLAKGPNGWKYPIYTPSSAQTVAERENDIHLMYALVMDSSVSQDVKDVLTRYYNQGRIEYIDNPYVNRTGEFDSSMSREQIFYGAHRTAITQTSPNGRAIQYSALMWNPRYGGGYLTEQFITTFLHEPIHHGSILGSAHTDAFYQRVNQEVRNFYDSYPSIEYRNHSNRIPSETASIRIYF